MMVKHTCDRCPLAPLNNFTIVEPRGNIYSKLFFIGEAPGYSERKYGYTFVGKAGRFLQYFVEEYGLVHTSYFTNAVKCRPPQNRTPLPIEVKTCRHKLVDELKDGKPKIVVLLGNTAVKSYFNIKDVSIGKLNNKVIVYNNTIIIFAYHPSYIMRDESRYKSYHELFRIIRALYKTLINKYI